MDIRGTVAHGSITLTRPLAHHSEFACACPDALNLIPDAR